MDDDKRPLPPDTVGNLQARGITHFVDERSAAQIDPCCGRRAGRVRPRAAACRPARHGYLRGWSPRPNHQGHLMDDEPKPHPLEADLHKHLKEQRPDLSEQQIRELLGEHGE